MPLGILSDDEFDSELGNSGIPPIGEVIVKETPGRKEGDINVPEGLRNIIGDSGLTDRQEALSIAKEFGISPASASAYSHGNTSTATYNKPNDKLSAFLNKRKAQAGKRASNKLLLALEHITEDKLEGAKATDLATIAKLMSGIVKEMEPESSKPTEGKGGPSFILYAPRIIQEHKLEVIDLKE